MNLILISPLTESEVRQIVAWRYEPPYDLYNSAPEGQESEIAYLLNPESHCYALREDDGTFLGFASFGADARVPGGDYSAPATDLGIGIRPDLTGRGQGKRFLKALLAYARARYADAPHFRVTVAAFNERAQRLVRGAGFTEVQRFARPSDGTEFVVLVL